MTDTKRTDPIPTDHICPNCNAQKGEGCTQPTQTGRRLVAWFHNARFDAARAT